MTKSGARLWAWLRIFAVLVIGSLLLYTLNMITYFLRGASFIPNSVIIIDHSSILDADKAIFVVQGYEISSKKSTFDN